MSIVWTNDSINFVHNEEITEWDISSANTSLMRYYKLTPDSLIDKLNSFDKSKREISVGKMIRKNPSFGRDLELRFTEIIETFLSDNHIDKDDDCIFSMKLVFRLYLKYRYM